MVCSAVPALAEVPSVPSVDTPYLSDYAPYQQLYTQDELKKYTLGPNDVIEVYIIVGDNARNLNYTFTISPSGEILIPNIGVVNLSNLTIDQAKQKITAEVKKYFKEPFRLYLVLKMPRVIKLHVEGDTVTVPYNTTCIYIYGSVNKTGRFIYLPAKKLSDYLNFAGGPTANANLSNVSVTRTTDGKSQMYYVNASDILYKGNRTNDMDIYPSDIINVPQNFFYFSDFASFANTIMLGLTLFVTVQSLVKR